MSTHQSWLQLFVETNDGVFLRRVPGASPLPDGSVGPAAETATRNAAMNWGLPDFVFRSAVRSRGGATRELGDVIICVGNLAAVVQVKARQASSGNPQKEENWLRSKIGKAVSQADGTMRALRRKERETLINERGNRVEVAYSSKVWVPIVVVDHPDAGGYLPEPGAVVLWRRDWEFLFDQLKSTFAVMSYLLRVLDLAPVPLGDEPERYYKLAAADADAPPTPMDVTGLDR